MSLPAPLDARVRAVLSRSQPPLEPTSHGCGYFDSGCYWNVCFACESERDPVAYKAKTARSNNIEIISAYFCTTVYKTAEWSNDLIAAVVHELDTPLRQYTDQQLADRTLVAAEGSLLAALRALLA
jgi:hypothetical protein